MVVASSTDETGFNTFGVLQTLDICICNKVNSFLTYRMCVCVCKTEIRSRSLTRLVQFPCVGFYDKVTMLNKRHNVTVEDKILFRAISVVLI